MKKIKLLLVAVMAVVCVSGVEAQIVKKSLAYVSTANDVRDNAFVSALSEVFNVTKIDATTTGTDYSAYDLIVLSVVPGSASAGVIELNTSGIIFDKPFVNMKMYQLFQSSRWNWVPTGGNVGNTTETTIVIPAEAKEHPLFTGITFSGNNSDEIVLSTGTANCAIKVTGWDTNFSPATPTVIASVKGLDAPAFCYAEIPVGTTIGTFGTTTKKQVVLGMSEASYETATADAIKIAVNAANYVAEGTTDDNAISADANVVNKEYFDITGKKVNADAKGFIIEKSYFEDGTVSSKKLFAF